MRESTSNVKFADLVNKFPKTSLGRQHSSAKPATELPYYGRRSDGQSKTAVRRETLTIPSNRNTPGRNSSNNNSEVAQPRTTWARYSASNNRVTKNNRRESMAVAGGRVSGRVSTGVKKSTCKLDK